MRSLLLLLPPRIPPNMSLMPPLFEWWSWLSDELHDARAPAIATGTTEQASQRRGRMECFLRAELRQARNGAWAAVFRRGRLMIVNSKGRKPRFAGISEHRPDLFIP